MLDALGVLCPFAEPVRLGLLVLPLRGPSRFFGGEAAVLDAVRRDACATSLGVEAAPRAWPTDSSARSSRRGARWWCRSGATDAFRRAQPLDGAADASDLATTGRASGCTRVGGFADLDARARGRAFRRAAVRVLHRVARGETGRTAGQRDTRLARAAAHALRGEDAVGDEQAASSVSAARATTAPRRRRTACVAASGADAVVVARCAAGAGPEDRASLVPWGAPARARRDDAPWPGQSARALAGDDRWRAPVRGGAARRSRRAGARGRARAAQRDAGDAGVLDAARAASVVWYAGPWPMVERWWAASRRRAHLQVLLDTGEAVLLAAESGRWWLAGIYD